MIKFCWSTSTQCFHHLRLFFSLRKCFLNDTTTYHRHSAAAWGGCKPTSKNHDLCSLAFAGSVTSLVSLGWWLGCARLGWPAGSSWVIQHSSFLEKKREFLGVYYICKGCLEYVVFWCIIRICMPLIADFFLSKCFCWEMFSVFKTSLLFGCRRAKGSRKDSIPSMMPLNDVSNTNSRFNRSYRI